MSARGSAQIPLLNILQALALNGQEGILTVDGPSFRRRILMLRYGMRPLNYHKDDPDLLKLAVLKQKLLRDSQLQNIFSTWTPDKCHPGDFLLRRRIIEEADVRDKIRAQLENMILDIFLAPNVRYDFTLGEDGRPYELFDPEGIGADLVYNVNSILMEAARRQDEWSRFQESISDSKEIYVLTDPSKLHRAKLDIAPQKLKEIRPHLNGTKTVDGIHASTTLSVFEVYDVLCRLATEGLIKPMEVAEKRKLADKLRKSLQVEEATDLYVSILAKAPEDAESRSRLIALLESSSGDKSVLMEQYVAMASELEGSNPERSIEFLRKAVEIAPGNVQARERLFSLCYSAGRHREATATLKAAVAHAKARPGSAETVKLLHRLAGYYPDEVHFHHELADAYLACSDRDSALLCLDAACDVYRSRRDVVKLSKVVDRIIDLKPEEAGRLRKMVEAQRRRRARSGSKLKLALSSLASASVLVFLAWFGIHEYESRVAFASTLEDVKDLKAKREYDSAVQILEEFRKTFAFTTKSSEADALAQTISELRDEERTASLQANDARRKEAEAVVVRAFIEESKENYAASLEALRGIDFDDLTAKSRERARELKTRLEAFFVHAEALHEQALRARKEGNIGASHRFIKRLITDYESHSLARNARLPVQIETAPPGADVVVKDTTIGETPGVFDFLPKPGSSSVKIVKAGYKTIDLSRDPIGDRMFDPLTEYKITLNLEKTSEWQFQTDAPVECVPVARDGKVYFGTRDGRVFCLAQATGRKLWEIKIPGGMDILGGLSVWNQALFFGSFDGKIHVLNATTGEPLQLPVSATANGDPIASEPASPTAGGLTAFNCGNRMLIGYTLSNHTIAWSKSFADHELIGPPRTVSDRFYAVTRDGDVLAIDAETGNVLGRDEVHMEVVQPFALSGRNVILAIRGGALVSYDLANSRTNWTYDCDSEIASPPTADSDAIVVTTSSGSIIYLSSEGHEKWKRNQVEHISAGGVIFRNSFLAGTIDGRVVSIDLWNNKPRWTYEHPRRGEGSSRVGFLSRGIVSQGRFLVGSEDRKFYSFLLD